jgi:hypothetical protein
VSDPDHDADADADAQTDADDPLAQPVYADGAYKPFGEFTLADVQARAAELKAATGWGPTARVGGVARGWSELSRTMSGAGAARVADLDHETAVAFARKLWVVPPGGSLL